MGDSSARHRRRRGGPPTNRLVRYTHDFAMMVNGRGEDVEVQLPARLQVATVLAPLGLRLSEARTRTVHIEEGSRPSGAFDSIGRSAQIPSGRKA
ncbi:hypothetical protein GCM10010191_58970 [Actinomadura vinacea]|uniref:Uncharacterized protein n=1 Tax=Actinomadura vinacea TaxID=115336 RepID=A0ABP5WXI4_9ACTN